RLQHLPSFPPRRSSDLVPYKGDINALTAIMSGEAHAYFTSSPRLTSLAADGRIKPLATAASKRSPQLPDIPTFAEAGYPDFIDMNAWLGVATVRGTPEAIVHRLNNEIQRIVALPEVATQLAAMGFHPMSTTPLEASQRLKHDRNRWLTLVKESGVTLH